VGGRPDGFLSGPYRGCRARVDKRTEAETALVKRVRDDRSWRPAGCGPGGGWSETATTTTTLPGEEEGRCWPLNANEGHLYEVSFVVSTSAVSGYVQVCVARTSLDEVSGVPQA